MDNVYLLIGGNLGNRVENLENAVKLINSLAGQVIRSSAIFETAAWGITDQSAFLNQAIELETPHQPLILLDILLEIELALGRIRREKNGPRLIDIDILFFGDKIISEPRLIIPHPLLQERRFALAPLNNISPDLMHPVLKKTVKQLLAECSDTLEAVPYTTTTGN